MKKVHKLICDSQPTNWFHKIKQECMTYPIRLMDIDNTDLIIDVGANVGGFMAAWSHISPNWCLVEPSKYNQEEITKNLRTFNYTLFKNAVGNKSGEVLKLQKYMQPDENKDTSSGNMGTTGFVYDDIKGHGWQGSYEEVESISFDDLCGGQNVGLLKVDCEGAEYDFLINKDLSRIKYITMELHNFLGRDKINTLCDFIGNTHSQIFSAGGLPDHYIKAWKIKSS